MKAYIDVHRCMYEFIGMLQNSFDINDLIKGKSVDTTNKMSHSVRAKEMAPS